MSFPFWDWRRSNGDPSPDRSQLDYDIGFEAGLEVATQIAEWMHGQDKTKALEHIENVRKSTCE